MGLPARKREEKFETVHFQHFPYDFFWILCLYILAFLNNHLSFSPI